MTTVLSSAAMGLPCPELWDRPVARAALAGHDMAGVFSVLRAEGFSQHQIGVLTGQRQPEISAILAGRRVIAYPVLSRIADGLAVPRGLMGLSWCTDPAHQRHGRRPDGPGVSGGW
jgi:hypothetical protein